MNHQWRKAGAAMRNGNPHFVLFSTLLVCSLWTGSAMAQPRLQFGRPANFSQNGFHLYNVTGGMGYTSTVGGVGISAQSSSGGDFMPYASTSFGYSRQNPIGDSFGITYSPGYTGRIRFSERQSFNQNLSVNSTHRMGSHWNSTFSLNGSDASVDQFIFNASSLALFAGTDGAPSDLGNGLSGALSGLVPRGNTILFGTRVRTAGGEAGLTYRPTVRWSTGFNISAGIARTKEDALTQFASSVIPRSVYGAVQANTTYALNPRTTVGVGGITSKNWSRLGVFQTSSIFAVLDRQLGVHWFVSVSGGPAFADYSTGVQTTSYAANSSLGYRIRQNTLVGTYRHAAGDQYGLGAGTTNSVLGAWNYTLRSTGWQFQAGGGQERLRGGGTGSFDIAQASGGISKSISRRLNTQLSYSYIDYSGRGVRGVSGHFARVGIEWIPLLRDLPLRPADPDYRAIPAGSTPKTK